MSMIKSNSRQRPPSAATMMMSYLLERIASVVPGTTGNIEGSTIPGCVVPGCVVPGCVVPGGVVPDVVPGVVGLAVVEASRIDETKNYINSNLLK